MVSRAIRWGRGGWSSRGRATMAGQASGGRGGRPGGGNRVGDGFVAAGVLAERGYQVRVLLLGEPGALRGDAAEAARLWRRSIEPATPAAVAGAGVIVDALFGAGLNRVIEGEAHAMID